MEAVLLPLLEQGAGPELSSVLCICPYSQLAQLPTMQGSQNTTTEPRKGGANICGYIRGNCQLSMQVETVTAGNKGEKQG